MHAFIYGTRAGATRAYRDDAGVHGYCNVIESRTGNGEATLLFDSAEDAEAVADKLRQLAHTMRQLEAQRLSEMSGRQCNPVARSGGQSPTRPGTA